MKNDKPDTHCRIGKITWKVLNPPPKPKPKPDLRSWFERNDTHYDRNGYCDNPGRGF